MASAVIRENDTTTGDDSAVRSHGSSASRVFPRGIVPLVVLAVSACCSLALLTTVPLHLPGAGLLEGGVDLLVYRTGGWYVLEGLPLYSGPIMDGLLYTYTPFSALLFAVVALLPTNGLVSAWLAFNVLVLFACIVTSWRILGYRFTPRLLVVSALLTATSMFLEPVRDTLQFGQINLILMLLVLAGFTGRNTSWLAGIGVGIATGIKLTPGLFIVFFAAARQWRAAASGAVTFAATVAIAWFALPGDSRQYWFHTFFDSSRIAFDGHLANQSVRGAIARLTGAESPTWLWLLVGGAVAVLGLYVAATLFARDERLLAAVVTGMTSSMMSPFSWSHHWVWFVPLIVFFVHRAVTSSAFWWAGAAAVYCATAAWVYNFPFSNPVVGLFLFPAERPVSDVSNNLFALLYIPILVMAYVVAVKAGPRSGRQRRAREPSPPAATVPPAPPAPPSPASR